MPEVTTAIVSASILLCLLGPRIQTVRAQAQDRDGAWHDAAPARVDLSAWGIRDAGSITAGQLSLLKDGAHPRYIAYYLSDEPPLSKVISMKRHRVDDTDVLFVTDLTENRNHLGGYFNTFQRSPSAARLGIDTAPDKRRGLRLRCERQDTGFCGLWIHLFDFSRPFAERAFLDATPYSHLSFWMRGSGLESLALKAADAMWEQREDALPLGLVVEFAAESDPQDGWQQFLIPLSILSDRVDRSLLASVVFEASAPGSYDLYMKDMSFVSAPRFAPALSDARSEAREAVDPDMAMWVWNTIDLLADAEKADSLVAFLNRQGFNRVFLQLPGDSTRKTLPGEIAIDVGSLRALVSRFARGGIEVEALDGYAGYARAAYHPGVLATVENVIAYNGAVDADEQFSGVRFDIEPYLLDGFHGHEQQAILLEFFDLLAAIADRCRAEELRFAVDIPFWYDARSKFSGRSVDVEYRGATKPASHHIIDLVDEVAIMDYRTVAWGADGTIRHGSGEIAYAAEAGKSVLIGLETYPLPDEELIEFEGRPEAGLPPVDTDAIIMTVQHDGAAVLGLSDSRGTRSETPVQVDGTEVWWWPVSRRIPVPAEKITFYSLGAERLEETLRETTDGFSRYPSFAGFAIHDSRSYQALVEEGSSPDAAVDAH